MARRNKKYLVSYRLKGATETTSEQVVAHDAACALGMVLDALDDDGAEPAFDYVIIRSEVTPKAKETTLRGEPNVSTQVTVTSALPQAIAEAYERAIAESKS